ncbi:MAG TPA: hypothetical protein VGF55_22240 [Gemmataceae bacterium]|jgi:hypothetical protein
MKRKASALALLAALGGCVSADKNVTGTSRDITPARTVAGVQGPYGEPVPVTTAKPKAPDAKSGVVQAAASTPAGKADGNVVQANYQVKKGTAPGLINPPPGAVAAVGALPGIPLAGGGMRAHGARTSIRFTSPAGMQIGWYAPSPDGRTGFTPTQVEVPGRYNFVQGGVYRLRLTNIPNRPALELYPTLEVMPANARTATFLAHSTVPIGFTEEDFEQVGAGNLVIKVVYLPDPQFQDLAVAGPDEVVSTRLEPGVDPILEAQRRGSVLAVIRMGNIDLEAPNTPPLNAPPQGGPFHGMPMMTAPGSLPPGAMPPGGMPPGGMMPGMVPPGGMPQTAPPLPAPNLPPPTTVPPGVQLPTNLGSKAPPSGNATVTMDGMIGRMK